MAFNTKEQQIIQWGMANGKSSQEVKDAISRFRITGSPAGPVQQQPSGIGAAVKDLPSDIAEGAKGVVQAIDKGLATGVEAYKQARAGEISPPVAALKAVGAVGKTAASIEGEGFMTLMRAFASPETERRAGEFVETKVGPIAKSVIESEPVQALIKKYEASTPEEKAAIDGLMGLGEGALSVLGLGIAKGVVKTGKELIETGARRTLGGLREIADTGAAALRELPTPKIGDARSLFKSAPKSIDDLAKQADEALKTQNISQNVGVDVRVNVPETKIDLDSVNKRLDTLIKQGKTAEARALAEQTTPKLSIPEKLAGVRPDIKARIAGKQDLLREYFDVANTRNFSDEVPTVYEYGGDFARKAADTMEQKLNEAGGAIGKTRQKLATYVAPIDDVASIENGFKSQLKKLNLEIVNGKVQQIPGTVEVVGAGNDINVLNKIYAQLGTVKEAPNLKNLIDFRSSLTNKVNFEKTAREVSSSVDAFSRQVQKDVARTAEKIVGKSNVADIRRYADFMDAFNDITSFTDRAAGGEYLIRLVLSGRGGEARQIIQTIKEYTGIDLMDHAVMSQLATEIVGNDAQKNLFRQEVAKAGMDAAKLLGGDPRGAMSTLFEKGMDRLLDPQKIFLEAAK